MPATYEPIATTTLGSAQASITFSSIPATYTDLRVVLCWQSAYDPTINFNSDTGSNYSVTQLIGNGSTATSGRETSATVLYSYRSTVDLTGNFALMTMDIFSYAGSTNKTCLITNNMDINGSGVVYRAVGLWRNTSAITTILLQPAFNLDTFKTGTTATLFGIKSF